MSGNTPNQTIIEAILNRDHNKVAQILADQAVHPWLRNAEYHQSPLEIAAESGDLISLALLITKTDVLDKYPGKEAALESCKKSLTDEFIKLFPEIVVNFLAALIRAEKQDLVLQIIDAIDAETLQNLTNSTELYKINFPVQVWQKIFKSFENRAPYLMLSYNKNNDSLLEAALDLLLDKNHPEYLNSFIELPDVFNLKLTTKIWNAIFTAKNAAMPIDNDSTPINIGALLIWAENNKNILKLAVDLIIEQQQVLTTKPWVIETAINIAIRNNDSDSLKSLIESYHDNAEIAEFLYSKIQDEPGPDVVLSDAAMCGIFKAQLSDEFNVAEFVAVLQKLSSNYKTVLILGLIKQLSRAQVSEVLKNDEIYNLWFEPKVWDTLINKADIEGSLILFLLQKAQVTGKEYFFDKAKQAILNDATQRELFFSDDSVFSQPFDHYIWLGIYDAAARASIAYFAPPSESSAVSRNINLEVVEQPTAETGSVARYDPKNYSLIIDKAVQHENVNLLVAAVSLCLENLDNLNAQDAARIVEALEILSEGISHVDEESLNIIRAFIIQERSGDIVVSDKLLKIIFAAALSIEDLPVTLEALRILSANKKNKLIQLILDALSDDIIKFFLQTTDLYEIALNVEAWEKLLPMAYIVSTKQNLVRHALSNNNVNLIVAIIKNYMDNQPENLQELISNWDFKAIRLILAEISKDPNYQNSPLWQVLQKLDSGTYGISVNAHAITDISPDFPMRAEVMLRAQDLFALKANIAEQGPQNYLYNPVLLQAMSLIKPPGNSFKYYLQNYSSCQYLFDLPKDAASAARLDLLKYMLRHHGELRDFKNYAAVVSMLIDENTLPKIDPEFVAAMLNFDPQYRIFKISQVPRIFLDKILIPMGFDMRRSNVYHAILNHSTLLSRFFAEAQSIALGNPLEIMLAAEFRVKWLLPLQEIHSGAQSAHDAEAAQNFDDFLTSYTATNPVSVPADEQLIYISLFMLFRLYVTNPQHVLITKLLQSPAVKELFDKSDYKDRDYQLFYANYMASKPPLLEYTLDRAKNASLNESEQFAIDDAINTKDQDYYAEQALICLRAVRTNVVEWNDDELVGTDNSQFVLNEGLRAGTANLIQYITSSPVVLHEAFKSHRDILKAIQFLSLKDAESQDRKDLFELYKNNKDKAFDYAIYAEKLEDIFSKRAKNDREVFCIQAADAITAYQQEGQQVSASSQSCLTGYKSRLNQLLDGDIRFGRMPTTLERMQKFLVAWMKAKLQDKLDTVTDVAEKRAILGRFLSTRVANAALVAAGKEHEMLQYFGDVRTVEAGSLVELADPSVTAEPDSEKFAKFFWMMLGAFKSSEIYNPEDKDLSDYEAGALYVLLQMGGGEEVIAELDDYFREQYGVKQQAKLDETIDAKSDILTVAAVIEHEIMAQKQSELESNTMFQIAKIKSKISKIVEMIIGYNHPELIIDEPKYDDIFDKLKQEIVDKVYPPSGNKTFKTGEFVEIIQKMLITPTAKPTQESHSPKPN